MPELSHATREAGCNRNYRCHRTDARPPDRPTRTPARITWSRLAVVGTPDAGSGCGQRKGAGDSRARRCRQARRERCGRAPAGSATRSAARCADRRNCSSRRCGRERPSRCASPARFAGEGPLRPRSPAARATCMPWSAGGVGRGVGTVAWDPRSGADFAADVAVPGAIAAGLALTGVLPEQVSQPRRRRCRRRGAATGDRALRRRHSRLLLRGGSP